MQGNSQKSTGMAPAQTSNYKGYIAWTGYLLWPDKIAGGRTGWPTQPHNHQLTVHPVHRVGLWRVTRRSWEWPANDQFSLTTMPWESTHPWHFLECQNPFSFFLALSCFELAALQQTQCNRANKLWIWTIILIFQSIIFFLFSIHYLKYFIIDIKSWLNPLF